MVHPSEQRSTREPDPYVVAHVREALGSDPRLNEFDVDVSLRGDDVYITGHVATEERQRAIDAVVAEVLPGHRVHNEVAVMAYREPDGQEHLG